METSAPLLSSLSRNGGRRVTRISTPDVGVNLMDLEEEEPEAIIQEYVLNNKLNLIVCKKQIKVRKQARTQ